MNKRAITPEKKREVIELVYQAWLRSPELRLGQMIFNYLGDDIFYMDDYELIEIIEKKDKEDYGK